MGLASPPNAKRGLANKRRVFGILCCRSLASR